MKEFASLSSLPKPLQARVSRTLVATEWVVWAGQPEPDEYQDVKGKVQLFGVAFLFIALILAITLFPKRMSTTGIIPPPFGYFVFVGFFLLPAIYFSTITIWSKIFSVRTLYLVTNKRVLLFGCWFRGNFVRSYEGEALRRIKVRKCKNGQGDVILEQFRTESTESSYETDDIGFYKIPDVFRIKRLIDAIAVDDA